MDPFLFLQIEGKKNSTSKKIATRFIAKRADAVVQNGAEVLMRSSSVCLQWDVTDHLNEKVYF